ncbi:tyrosine-type recombinase/integrase [Undibacterium fentianense]|uniref:Tyrosine-type recombinase/integrase n=1 Tax=Undibacterium fentianense TaxID=2828728 RepID=A0A941E1E4_9BURK|nr:tyrosine-type recombinase/integrase [Undibacterium fentianense]MBR7798869.1 tyrosine-type recombinase/integrase [Undibacterium fentianense]
MATLTDVKARSITSESGILPHGGVTGLALHPSNTKGSGKWVLRFVSPITQKRRNAGLGSYPEVSIAQAAKAAIEMRSQIEQGIDPLEEKAKIAKVSKAPTFQEASKLLHAELLPSWKNDKHGQQWINTLEQYVFPIIGKLLLDQIQPRHIADTLRPIWLEIPETAGRVKQRIHAVMAWAWAHEYCPSNPVDVVQYLLPPQPSKSVRTKHQPAMPWADIPLFIKTHLRNGNKYDVTRPMLEFLILTAARSGEVREMTWSEVNFQEETWIVPAERMKAKLLHRVPLSKRAIEILRSQQGFHEELVFPSPRKQKELSDMVLTSFLRRVKAKSDTPGRFATAHGFRSSFRDWCSEQGYARDLAERSLAHTVQNKVEAAYHRTDLLEQRRSLLETWSHFCTSRNQQIV